MLKMKKRLTAKQQKRQLIQLILFKPDLSEMMSWDGMKSISDGKFNRLKARFFIENGEENANI